jgi:hypothetical protein
LSAASRALRKELKTIVNLIEAYEAKRWPLGKDPPRCCTGRAEGTDSRGSIRIGICRHGSKGARTVPELERALGHAWMQLRRAWCPFACEGQRRSGTTFCVCGM